MRFGIIPPVRTGVTADPAWMSSFVGHAESCGFESVVLVEHAVVISDYRSTYPYASSGRMPLPDDCPIPDPIDLMAFLAATTDRIVLATGVLVLPNHQAVVLAKRIATVDVLSRGRVRLCVGVGWMDEELLATGADPRSRGRRTDETIAAMRTLWSGAGAPGAEFDGEFVSFHHAHSYPKPVRTGGVPIHIGGHSEAAARRAGRLGDGFQPLGLSAGDLALRLVQMREAAEGSGRDPNAVELTLSGYLPTTTEDEVVEAESVGAARLVVSTSMTGDLAQVHDELSAFADRFGLPSREETGNGITGSSGGRAVGEGALAEGALAEGALAEGPPPREAPGVGGGVP